MTQIKDYYWGKRIGIGVNVVQAHDRNRVIELPTCSEIVNHSPDSFEWGYGGSGPAQLSFAILMHFTDDEKIAKLYYQKFKWEVISKLHDDSWVIPFEFVNDWIEEQHA